MSIPKWVIFFRFAPRPPDTNQKTFESVLERSFNFLHFVIPSKLYRTYGGLERQTLTWSKHFLIGATHIYFSLRQHEADAEKTLRLFHDATNATLISTLQPTLKLTQHSVCCAQQKCISLTRKQETTQDDNSFFGFFFLAPVPWDFVAGCFRFCKGPRKQIRDAQGWRTKQM